MLLHKLILLFSTLGIIEYKNHKNILHALVEYRDTQGSSSTNRTFTYSTETTRSYRGKSYSQVVDNRQVTMAIVQATKSIKTFHEYRTRGFDTQTRNLLANRTVQDWKTFVESDTKLEAAEKLMLLREQYNCYQFPAFLKYLEQELGKETFDEHILSLAERLRTDEKLCFQLFYWQESPSHIITAHEERILKEREVKRQDRLQKQKALYENEQQIAHLQLADIVQQQEKAYLSQTDESLNVSKRVNNEVKNPSTLFVALQKQAELWAYSDHEKNRIQERIKNASDTQQALHTYKSTKELELFCAINKLSLEAFLTKIGTSLEHQLHAELYNAVHKIAMLRNETLPQSLQPFMMHAEKTLAHIIKNETFYNTFALAQSIDALYAFIYFLEEYARESNDNILITIDGIVSSNIAGRITTQPLFAREMKRSLLKQRISLILAEQLVEGEVSINIDSFGNMGKIGTQIAALSKEHDKNDLKTAIRALKINPRLGISAATPLHAVKHILHHNKEFERLIHCVRNENDSSTQLEQSNNTELPSFFVPIHGAMQPAAIINNNAVYVDKFGNKYIKNEKNEWVVQFSHIGNKQIYWLTGNNPANHNDQLLTDQQIRTLIRRHQAICHSVLETNQLTQQEHAYRTYQQDLQEKYTHAIKSGDLRTADKIQQRLSACSTSIANKFVLIEQEHSLTERTQQLLRQKLFDPKVLLHYQGTHLQQQIHKELLGTLEEASEMSSNETIQGMLFNTMQLSSLVHQLNYDGHITQATSWLDTMKTGVRCLRAFGEGVNQSLEATAHSIEHFLTRPTEFLESCINSINSLIDLAVEMAPHVKPIPSMHFFSYVKDGSFDIKHYLRDCIIGYTIDDETLNTIYNRLPNEFKNFPTTFCAASVEEQSRMLGYITSELVLFIYGPRSVNSYLAKSGISLQLMESFGHQYSRDVATLIGTRVTRGQEYANKLYTLARQHSQCIKTEASFSYAIDRIARITEKAETYANDIMYTIGMRLGEHPLAAPLSQAQLPATFIPEAEALVLKTEQTSDGLKYIDKYGNKWFAQENAWHIEVSPETKVLVGTEKTVIPATELHATLDEILPLTSKSSNLTQKLKNIAHSFSPTIQQFIFEIDQEINVLSKKYAGTVIHTPHFTSPIIITHEAIEHVIGGEIIAVVRRDGKLKLNGLHHNIERWEKVGLFEITEKARLENGVRSFLVKHNDVIIKGHGTAFPSNWTNKMVIEALKEATCNIIKKSPAQANENIALIGKTSCNVNIKIVINPQGEIQTFYPTEDIL